MMIVATLFIFVGCDASASRTTSDIFKSDEECRFEYLGVEEHPNFKDYFYYYRDTVTDVVYIAYKYASGNGTYGGLTPLLDSDGTPILWNEIQGELK